jgi:aminoglycoside phosphotransferase
MLLDTTEPGQPAPLSLLLGADAPDLLAVAVEACGWRLRGLRVATVGVQPSGATVVRYDADIERPDGTPARESLVATTGDRIPAGAAVLAGQGTRVGIWRWPHDPALPALAVAADPTRLAATLLAAGLPRTAPPEIRVRGYRPGRRAVLEINGGGPRLYAKVVRPSAVDAMRARHELLAPYLPVPRVLTATPDGLLVLPELPGTPLRTILAADSPPPAPAALEAVLDALPDALLALPARRGHLQRVRHFTGVLALTAVTAAADRARLDALAAALADVDAAAYPHVPVHGDLHEGQVLTDGGTVTGLLDLDTAGPGQRIDDWATMLAHLSVLALHSTRPEPARRYGATLLAAAETRYPRVQLRSRIAAAVLGLATGPFRVQQDRWREHTHARLALTEQWLAG